MSIEFSHCATISFYLFDKVSKQSFKIEREVNVGDQIDWERLIEEEEIKYSLNRGFIYGNDGGQKRVQSKDNDLRRVPLAEQDTDAM